MNDLLMSRLELRDHASLAKSVEKILGSSLEAIDRGKKPPAPSRIQGMQIQRMQSFLADSARASGHEPARLVADPALGRPRSQAERQTIYALVRRVRPQLKQHAVATWVNDAYVVLEATRQTSLGTLPKTKLNWARTELEPFLETLGHAVQDFREDSRPVGLTHVG